MCVQIDGNATQRSRQAYASHITCYSPGLSMFVCSSFKESANEGKELLFRKENAMHE